MGLSSYYLAMHLIYLWLQQVKLPKNLQVAREVAINYELAGVSMGSC
jgi:hypothetical protein